MRRTEEELWQEFEAERPTLFGTICDLLSAALGNYRSIVAPAGIRMADAARWAIGGMQFANWNAEELGSIWRSNRHAANIVLLEGDIVGSALLDYLEQHPEGWEGRHPAPASQAEVHQSDHHLRSWSNRATAYARPHHAARLAVVVANPEAEPARRPLPPFFCGRTERTCLTR